MALTSEIKTKIKDEINNDPEGRGYAGKSSVEQAILLNASYNKIESITVSKPSRINSILAGIAKTSNISAASDVDEALVS